MHEIYNGIDIGKVKINEFKYYAEELAQKTSREK